MLTQETGNWIVRLGEVFTPIASALWEELGAPTVTPLGGDLHSLHFQNPIDLTTLEASCFLRWQVPVHHVWPTQPSKTEGFVEKAAQGLARKFGSRKPHNVLVTAIRSDPHSRSLASNVRGRALQVFDLVGKAPDTEDVDPDAAIVLALVGPRGLLAGLTTPRQAKSFYASGVRYVKQSEDAAVSRAGAKIVESLSLLRLCRAEPHDPSAARWLELGASPGGMTAELLHRGFSVTALDRAPLSPLVNRHPSLEFRQEDVSRFEPTLETHYEALLCDMNGPWQRSAHEVLRLSRWLKSASPIVFTLKFNELTAPQGVLAALRQFHTDATRAGLKILMTTHSSFNRNEITCLFQKT
jgi:23S rRNA (cytidine2498-2'-O)-methyltransferase